MASKYDKAKTISVRTLTPRVGMRVVDGLCIKEWDGPTWLVLGVACNRDYHAYPVVLD